MIAMKKPTRINPTESVVDATGRLVAIRCTRAEVESIIASGKAHGIKAGYRYYNRTVVLDGGAD